MTDIAFRIRDLQPEDRAYIARSWVGCMAHDGDANAHLLSPKGKNRLVSLLLDRCQTRVMLDDADLIAGFICWQPWGDGVAVHYVWMRLMYRAFNLEARLVAELPSVTVYCTNRSQGVLNVPKHWTYTTKPVLDLVREAA